MSRNNQVTDPAFALTLNPFNADAAVNLVVDALNGEADPDLNRLAAVARRVISTSPADARGYSLLGAVEEHGGGRPRAQALYSLALDHSKSELHALLRTAQADLEDGDTAAALERIDLLLRRWPDYWDQVLAVLRTIASDQDKAVLLARKLGERPPWRARAIAALAKEPATLGLLRDLVASFPADLRSDPGWLAERDTVIAALVSNDAFTDAYSLFLTTLTEEEKRVAGYVFDGGFELPVGRGYFGWRIQRRGAIDVKPGRQDDTGQTALQVKFLDSPARPGIVTQNLMLPFGQYRFAVAAAATGLRTPKNLYWSVRCVQGSVLAKLPVPEGSLPKSQLQIDLEVPASGCSRQVLSLDTDVRTESWRDRYQGEVRFSDLVITRR